MSVNLNLSSDSPADTKFPQLGTQRYQVRVVWRERTASWYLDLLTEAGADIVRGLRLVPGNSPALRLGPWRAQGPGGALLVRGPSGYVRDDLGGSVQVVWYADDELPTAADDGLTVVV